MASKKTEIPKHEIDTLAKEFLPEILAFFETEEGKKRMKSIGSLNIPQEAFVAMLKIDEE